MFEEFSPKRQFYARYELIVKLSIFDKPLRFLPILDSLNRFAHNYRDDDYSWLLLETIENTTHVINKQHIEWFVIHDEGNDDWPELARDGFHKTILMDNGIDAATTVMAMAINAAVSDDTCEIDLDKLEIDSVVTGRTHSYPLQSDFEWLVEHECTLFHKDNIELRESRKNLDYEAALKDQNNLGWFEGVKEAWGGVRTFLMVKACLSLAALTMKTVTGITISTVFFYLPIRVILATLSAIV